MMSNLESCTTVHKNIPGQGGGERKSGVAKQGTRAGLDGGKQSDNADKQDRQTRTRSGQDGTAKQTRTKPGQAQRTRPSQAPDNRADKTAHGAATAIMANRFFFCLGNKRTTQSSPSGGHQEDKRRTQRDQRQRTAGG